MPPSSSIRRRAPLAACCFSLLALPGGSRADTLRLDSKIAQESASYALPRGSRDVEQAAASFRDGKPDEALAHLQTAVANDNSLPPARALLGILYLSNSQFAQGRNLLEQAAIEAPDNPELYLLFGRIALTERRLTDAFLAFDKAASLPAPAPWNDDQKRTLKHTCADSLATVAEARQQWPVARARLEELLQLDPKNAQARQRLARALFNVGLYNDAFDHLKQASSSDPSVDPPGLVMGRLYYQKSDLAKAEEWMNYAVKAAPESASVRLARAAWLIEVDRASDARLDTDFVSKLAADPSVELRRLRGVIAFIQKDYQAAEAEFEAILETSPQHLAAANFLAQTLSAQDDQAKKDRGYELASAQAKQYPNATPVLATLAWAQFRAGHQEEAEQTMRSTITRGQITSDMAFQFAQILAARGQAASARQLVQGALGQRGTFLAREEASRWLASLPDAEPANTP